jgi:predicted Fe-Mo cluster-binding NifX family protein
VRIALGVENDSAEAALKERFGRSPVFAVYDTGSKETTYLKNPENEDRGAGVKTARMLLKNQVDAAVVIKIGERAFEVLHKAGVLLWEGNDGTVNSNIDLFTSGKLHELPKANA